MPLSVWVIVEVVEAKVNNHVYLDLAERDAQGSLLARARAMIWSREAASILGKFESDTGMSIGPGIKLLVRARPTFAAQYGFSLTIDALDSDYTLGDLEARKRELRARLTQEGLWDRNRRLEKPWDFNEVLVVSPHSAAGLGDFQAEASRLERAGLCRFVYVHSRFQGDGAAHEIAAEAERALEAWTGKSTMPDALVLIRGGGSVNDLAWLNDYTLARFVCLVPVPVFTGIGHEKDTTIVDEVAHTRFDTPSKVIAGIEVAVAARARETEALYNQVTAAARRRIFEARQATEQVQADIRASTARGSQKATRSCDATMEEVRTRAMRTVRLASDLVREDFVGLRAQTKVQVAQARQQVPALLTRVGDDARTALATTRANAAQRLDAVVQRASSDAASRRRDVGQSLDDAARFGKQALAQARNASESLFREVNGQGPDKTLARGFAHVRDGHGRTVKSAGTLLADDPISITFRDGVIPARVRNEENEE
jgi:exodeoxyribonuclease VII large subunit